MSAQDVPVVLDAWAAEHGRRRVSDLMRAVRAEWQFEAAAPPVGPAT